MVDRYLFAKLMRDLHRRPVPYECDITPRFPEASGLLAQELELRGL
jgi:hypothetical protein